MNTFQTTFQSLTKLTLRFGLFALVFTLVATASRAASLPTITVVSGNYQSTSYGSAFASPLVVQVTNPSTKLGVPGVQVNFTAKNGIALSAPSAVTGSNGQASVTATATAAPTSAANAPTVTAQSVANAASTATFAMVVRKVVLTIVPADEQSIAGVIPQFHDYSLTGFVNGDTATTANITGAPVITTGATAAMRASTYGITGNVGSLAASNYSFLPGKGLLTLVGVPMCGNLGSDISSVMNGTYAFNLFDQQRGYSGTLTMDGTSKITGQTFYNGDSEPYPSLWSIAGNYRVGNGLRGGAALLRTPEVNPTIAYVSTVCFSVDNVVGGVANSGRLIEVDGYQSSTAGTFYRLDGSASSLSSFKGTYIAGLQGTRLDTNTGNPLQYAMVAALNLDGDGNVTGSLSDVDALQSTGGTPTEQYTAKQPISGSYTYDSVSNTGVITLDNGTTLTHLTFIAQSSQHLLLMTEDAGVTTDGSSSSTVYFGEAQKQAAGPFSAASFSGNASLIAQGIDAYSGSYTPRATGASVSNGLAAGVIPADTITAGEGLVAEVGGMSFDGVGTYTHQNLYTLVDGLNASTQTSTNGIFSYTVDPATGRFESRDPSTNACTLCGYLVGPNTLVALSPGSGIPLFATITAVSTPPATLKLSTLRGTYSGGTIALISPLAQAFSGRLTFDGKGNFSAAVDTYSTTYGGMENLSAPGTYTVVNGAFALTLTGSTSPDFYLYLNSQQQAVLVPFSAAETSTVPLLTLNNTLTP